MGKVETMILPKVLALFFLLPVSCHNPSKECCSKWINKSDPSEFDCTQRSLSDTGNYIILSERLQNKFRIYCVKQRTSDSAFIRVNTHDAGAITKVAGYYEINIGSKSVRVVKYILDEIYTYDEELFFFWTDDLGFFLFGGVHGRDVYRYVSCDKVDNLLIDILLAKMTLLDQNGVLHRR